MSDFVPLFFLSNIKYVNAMIDILVELLWGDLAAKKPEIPPKAQTLRLAIYIGILEIEKGPVEILF